jgi:predicted Zn-dependent protease
MRRSILLALSVAWLQVGPALAHPTEAHRIETLTEAIRAHPDEQDLYIRRGRSYANDGRLDLALTDLRKAESLGDPALAAYDLGIVLYRKGSLVEARQAFTLCLERFPNHAPALEYRARVARDAGDPAAALADFDAYFALQERPNPGDYVSAARLLEEGEAGSDAALRMLDRGMERLGVIAQLQRPAIDLERRRGRVDSAIDRLMTLEPALGRSPDWKVDMAELLLASGRRDEALTRIGEASRQLDGLRQTAARRALRGRLEALRARATAPDSGATPAPPAVTTE